MEDFGASLEASFGKELKLKLVRGDDVSVLLSFKDLFVKSSMPLADGSHLSFAAVPLGLGAHHFPAFLARSSCNSLFILDMVARLPLSYCSYLYGESFFISSSTRAKKDFLSLFVDRHLICWRMRCLLRLRASEAD